MISDRPLLQFRLLGVPVEIGMTALLLVAFLALSYGRSGTGGLALGALTAVILIASILVHELGHAVVGTRLGLDPRRIMLHGFGGYTEYGKRPSARDGVISSLAGPIAGLLLGGLLVVVQVLLGGQLPSAVVGLLSMAIFINIFWSLFNLLPIYPMDGGQVLWYGLRLRMNASRADRIVRNVTVPTAIVVGIVGYMAGYVFIPLICFFAIMQVIKV